jgi:hypothetical protein
MKKPDDEVSFKHGDRQKALQDAIDIVKRNRRSAQLIVCRDIRGYHTGGEDCFCDPKIIVVNENGEIQW